VVALLANVSRASRRAAIRTLGAIWLDADIALLAERVSRRETRPLLKDKDPVAVLTGLAAIRNPIYAQAHLHMRSQPAPHDNVVERIVAALALRGRTDPEIT